MSGIAGIAHSGKKKKLERCWIRLCTEEKRGAKS